MNLFKRSKFTKAIAKTTGVVVALALFVGVGVNTASAAGLTASQVSSILALLQSFGADQATISNVNAALTGAPTTGGTSTGGSTSTGGTNTGYTFTRNLTVGDTGEDVRQLQMILNSDAATMIASSGVGSAGNETTYFGGLTKTAVIKFQNKYASEVLAPVGLSAGTGFVGASSRAKLNTMTSGGSTSGNTNTGNTGTTVPSGSGLTITEVPVNAGGFLTVPYNVSAMTFAKFNFTAGNSPVEITKMRIVRSELGDKDDFDEVWITVNGMQKGNERSIVTGDYADFDLSNDKIFIGSGQTVVVEIRASLTGSASDAGHYNRLGIGSITANVPVSSTLPVNGPLTNISTQAAATVTMTAQGSDKTISVGNTQTEIGRFKLDVSSSNSQDVIVKEIKLENQGTSNDLAQVISNVKLKVGGTVVSSNIQLSGDVMVITLNDYLMEDGQTQSFTIVADVIGAETSDTIQLQLDEDSDLFAMEAGSGAGVRVDGEDGSSTSPASNVDLKTYTVETGDVNFAIGNASSRSIAPGLDDVLLLDGTITVDSPIRADGIKVRLYTGTDTDNDTIADLNADFENVTLRIDDVALDVVDTLTNADGSGTAFVTGSSGDYYNFDSKFTLEEGAHHVVVEADVKSAATAADKIKLVIYASDMDSPEYIASGDTVPSGELTGQIDGSLITVQASSLVANRNDGFSSETIIGGSKNIEFFKFTLTANDSSEVRVNSITVGRDDSESSYAASNVTNMKLFVDGVQKGSTIDLSSGTFTDADFVVPKSGQVQVMIKVDSNTASTSANLAIEVTSVDATDEEGNSVTVTRASDGSTIASGAPLGSDTFTVATGGSFTLSVDGDSPDEDVIVADGGSVWYPVVRYRATAESEDLKITDLYLFNAATTTAILGGTGSTSYADARIQTLAIFDANGVKKAEKSFSNGLVHFDLGEAVNASGLGPIIVPKNDTAKFDVRVKVNNIVDGDKTGRALRLALDPYNGTGDTGVIVQSTAVGSDLASTSIVAARDNDGTSTNGTVRGTTSIASDLFSLRRTKPTITTVDQGSATTLTNGSSQVLYKFKVTADSAEDVAWKGIKFDVRGKLGTTTLSTTTGAGTFVDTTAGSAQGLTAATTSNSLNKVTAFKLFNTSTNQEVQNGSYSVQLDWDDTNDNGEVAIVLNNGVEETVAAGSSKTYELRATVAGGTSDNGNFISVTIDDESDDNSSTAAYYVEQKDPDNVDGIDTGSIIMTANATTTSGYTPYTFLWSDFSGSPHSADNEISAADDKDWTNDRLISIDGGTWTRTYAN